VLAKESEGVKVALKDDLKKLDEIRSRPRPTNNGSGGSSYYTSLFDDMRSDYVKYYNQFGGNVAEYKRQLSYVGHMADLDNHNVPKEYRQYADIYSDMRRDPDKYVSQMGGSGYKSELNRVKELFGMEKKDSGRMMDLMDRSSIGNWNAAVAKTPELGAAFQYDPNNYDDYLLASAGYAPTSFSSAFSQAKIENKLSTETTADMLKKADDEYLKTNYATATVQGQPAQKKPLPSDYLTKLYQYDLTDPDDIVNKAFGLMPKAFKYANNPEDEARKALGKLPLEAETYEKNSREFDSAYQTYSQQMQKYTDEKAVYDSTPWLSRLFSAAPEAPEAPEIIKRVQQYYDEKDNGVFGVKIRDYTTESGYSEDEEKIDVPFMYLGESRPSLNAEEYAPSADAVDLANKVKNNGALYTAGSLGGIKWNAMVEVAKGQQAAEKQADTIKSMKASGEWGRLMQQQADIDNQISANLDENSEYTPDKYKFMMDNIDYMQSLGGTYGLDEVNENAQSAVVQEFSGEKSNWARVDTFGDPVMQEVANEIKNMGLLGTKIVDDEAAKKYGYVWSNIFGDYGTSPENNKWDVQDIFQFYRHAHGLGLLEKGNQVSIDKEKAFEDLLKTNPELITQIDSVVNKANYRVMQKQRTDILGERENLKNKPAWETAIYEGLSGGLSGYQHSRIQTGAEYFKTMGDIFGWDTTGSTALVKENAKQFQGEMERGQYNVSLGTGDKGVAQDIYNVSNMVAVMAPDLWQGSMIPDKATDAGKALSIWGKLGNKLKMNRSMRPFFTSSLGYNLMQAENEGRGGAEGIVSSVAASYVESILEQSTGFFSKGNPAKKLLSKGIKGMPMRTLKNMGVSLLKNLPGEIIEENLQNISSNAIKHGVGFLMNSNYNPQTYGDIINPTEMWQTTKTTFWAGLLLSAFSVPEGFRSFKSSRRAETRFNAAVEAYQNGDMNEFNRQMLGDKKTKLTGFVEELDMTLSALKEDMDSGAIKEAGDVLAAHDNLNPAMMEMYNAVQSAAGLDGNAGGRARERDY
jgi:hypothetical protein